MRSLLCLAALALAAEASEQWCYAPRDDIAGAAKMYRGTYTDFSLYVAPPGMLEGCVSFHKHEAGNDGLWLLQFRSQEKFDELRRGIALAEGVYVAFTGNNSMVVGGGEHLPAKLGVDACGTERAMDVIPLPTFAVKKLKPHSPELTKRAKQPYNPDIQTAVDSIAPERIIAVIHLLQSYNTRNSYSEQDLPDAVSWTDRMYTGYNYTVERVSFRDDMAPNVVATKLGTTEPNKVIVVGAHLDSRSTDVNSPTQRAPGADDNASGCSALLAIAQTIFELNLEFEYTIRFVAFTGEEQGLLGSAALAAAWAAGGMDIVAMFNADMLGWKLPDQPVTLGFKDRSVSIPLTEEIRELIPQYVRGLPTAYSSSCCSDYLSFHNQGFPSVGFFENEATASAYPHYHTSTDLQQYLDSIQLHLHTQALAATVLTYAGLITAP